MTTTNNSIPTTTSRHRGRTGVAALSLAVGAALGIAGTVLATGGDDGPARPAVVQPHRDGQPGSDDAAAASACRQMSADAAERCLATD